MLTIKQDAEKTTTFNGLKVTSGANPIRLQIWDVNDFQSIIRQVEEQGGTFEFIDTFLNEGAK